jgi:hypothetical protein
MDETKAWSTIPTLAVSGAANLLATMSKMNRLRPYLHHCGTMALLCGMALAR